MAITSLILSFYCGAWLIFAVLRASVPRNLFGMLPDRPVTALALAVLVELGAVALLMIGAVISGMVWLVLMKSLFSKGETLILLGLDLGKATLGKKLVKRYVEFVF